MRKIDDSKSVFKIEKILPILVSIITPSLTLLYSPLSEMIFKNQFTYFAELIRAYLIILAGIIFLPVILWLFSGLWKKAYLVDDKDQFEFNFEVLFFQNLIYSAVGFIIIFGCLSVDIYFNSQLPGIVITFITILLVNIFKIINYFENVLNRTQVKIHSKLPEVIVTLITGISVYISKINSYSKRFLNRRQVRTYKYPLLFFQGLAVLLLWCYVQHGDVWRNSVSIDWNNDICGYKDNVIVGNVKGSIQTISLSIYKENEKTNIPIRLYTGKSKTYISIDFSGPFVAEGVYVLKGKINGKNFNSKEFCYLIKGSENREKYIDRLIDSIKNQMTCSQKKEMKEEFCNIRDGYLKGDTSHFKEIALKRNEILSREAIDVLIYLNLNYELSKCKINNIESSI